MKSPVTPTPAKQQEQQVAQQPTFSFLKGLTEFSGAPTDKLGAARELVVVGAEKQKVYVSLLKDGQPLPRMEGGKKAISTWFKQVSKGWKCSIRYGQQSVPLTPTGETYVLAGTDPPAVTAFLDAVIASVRKGELDEQLKALQALKSKALTAAHAKKRKAKEDAKAATLTQDVAKELEEAA